MYRLFAISVVLFWLAAMSALFMRDVWPSWTAQEPPAMTAEQLARLEQRDEQYGILAADGRVIGTAWSRVSRASNSTTINGLVFLDGLPQLPILSIKSDTTFEEAGGLDSFTLSVHGLPLTRIRVHGERRGIYFPCELRLGPIERKVNLDLAASRMIGESMRPFAFLPDLKVGQSWRMQLLNPLSAALSAKADFTSIVATVTHAETIEHPAGSGEHVTCLVVETSPGQARAWVDPDGRVLVQEVDMPPLGRVTIREEPLDETRYNAARDHTRQDMAAPGGVRR